MRFKVQSRKNANSTEWFDVSEVFDKRSLARKQQDVKISNAVAGWDRYKITYLEDNTSKSE